MVKPTQKKDVDQRRQTLAAVSTEPNTLSVLTSLVAAIEALQLLESVYGSISESGCRVVCIANELTSEQCDTLWKINWEFQARYPQLDIDMLLIQRHGRPLSEVFSEGNSTIIKHDFTNA